MGQSESPEQRAARVIRAAERANSQDRVIQRIESGAGRIFKTPNDPVEKAGRKAWEMAKKALRNKTRSW